MPGRAAIRAEKDETVKNGIRKVAVSKKGVKYPAIRSIVLLKP